METFSIMLFTKLCRYIGTRERLYIRRKQTVFKEKVVSCRERKDSVLYLDSGSVAEGLMLPGSDIDSMGIITEIYVLPLSGGNVHQADLITETQNVKPGFVRLRVTDKFLHLQTRLDCIITCNNAAYLSSMLFSDTVVKLRQQRVVNAVPHGPCATNTLLFNIEHDVVYCFACRVWPEKASEWINRHRPCNWPSRDLIQHIVSDGCLFVPIGNPHSQLKAIEWRISFSVAERRLVYSMNHTQILCYGLLKLFLKYVIESKEAVKDLLCSYFLKTCLFYCIEESIDRWEKENLLNWFWTCFKRLFYWVRDGYCPNYFIKDNNMFEGKMFGVKQTTLLEHLSNLYSDGIDSFVLIPCLRDLIFRFRNSIFRGVSSDAILNISDTENECLIDKEIFSLRFQCHLKEISLEIISLFLSVVENQNVLSLLDVTLQDICLYSHEVLVPHILFHKYVHNVSSNKDKYKHLKILQNFILHVCSYGDICTGWLQYATLCYITGQYHTVIRIVNYILSKFKPCTMYTGFCTLKYSADIYIQEVVSQGLTVLQKMNLVVANTYQVIPNRCFYPAEIKSEIIHYSHKRFTFVPPVVYSNVLLFLSYKALRRTELKRLTLNELYTATLNDHFVTELERPLAIALFDKCSQLDNVL